MSVTQEQQKRIAAYPAEEHGHIVDSFAALARDPMTIAIRQGIDLEDVVNILHAYDLSLGSDWGDEKNDAGSLRRCPEKIVKEYVDMYYPGLTEERRPHMGLHAFVISRMREEKK